jgi:hypothetical protein
MFDLKVVFKESVFYPFNQQYKTDKMDPNNKENLMKTLPKMKPLSIKKTDFR